MRNINLIIVHCSATTQGLAYTAKDIDRWHKANGFRCIGYHYVVDLDGTIEVGRPLAQVGAHCTYNGKSYNTNSIGICYIGGCDAKGNPKDTRTDAQKASLLKLLKELKAKFPKAKIIGHYDISPDKNHNGKVDNWEKIKACPCFDAKNEYKDL